VTEESQVIRKFFATQEEAIKFLVYQQKSGIGSPDGEYIATLEKHESGAFLFMLISAKKEIFVADFVRPFRCSQEKIDQFNQGVDRLADIMLEYEKVSVDRREDFLKQFEDENVFGDLTANVDVS
jgi:hypothetical protein